MSFEIIGAESLGVRGLCCLVTLQDRRIVIEPGVSLGYLRHGLPPHPVQIAEGRRVREKILYSLNNATDVVPPGPFIGVREFPSGGINESGFAKVSFAFTWMIRLLFLVSFSASPEKACDDKNLL